MIELITAIWASAGLLFYYLILQWFSMFVKSGMAHNTPNRMVMRLSHKYDVNIKTFQKNNNLQGFAWFNTIWLNENLFKKRDRLLFTFHHEYYHIKHHHKALVLTMRLVLSLIPLLLTVCPWFLWVFIFLGTALAMHHVKECLFEKKANDYASKMISNGNGTAKRTGSN